MGMPLTYTISEDSVKVIFDGSEYGGAVDGKNISIDGDNLRVSMRPKGDYQRRGSEPIMPYSEYVPMDSCPAALPAGIQYFIP